MTARDLEQELARDNPKGCLWERCAQLRLEPPRVRHRTIRSMHQAEMSLDVDESEISSGVHSGDSRKVVEQLAARELLAELEQLLEEHPRAARASASTTGDEDDVWEIDTEDAERLRSLNPKGQVFEWCQKRKIAKPRFELRKAPGGGAYVRATLITLGLSSPWFRAAQVKHAEQAAAEALVPLLPDDTSGPSKASAQLDPRSALNELRQRGAIAEYAFDITALAEPASGRRFTAVGRMVLADGRAEVTEPMEGGSKKEVALLAARMLLERVPQASA